MGLRRPNYVIIHHTATNGFQEVIQEFTNPGGREASSHYLICKDGTVYHMLNDLLRSHHAGDSKWGNNSAYITGYEKTDMGAIMQKNLEGTGFTFYPDPYPDQQLFYRSDNATLARLGVPAHTISTSKMDSEPNYHKVTDHIETLDMENMAIIIKAIALSSKSIIAGKETPTRVKVEELR